MSREEHLSTLRELLAGERTAVASDAESLEFLIIDEAGKRTLNGFDKEAIAGTANRTFSALVAEVEGPDRDPLRRTWGRVAWHMMLHWESTAAACAALECVDHEPGPIWHVEKMQTSHVVSMVLPRVVEGAKSFEELLMLLTEHLFGRRAQEAGTLWLTAGEAAREAVAFADDEEQLDALEDALAGQSFGDRDFVRDMIDNKRLSFRSLQRMGDR